jgi:hypothetical protein
MKDSSKLVTVHTADNLPEAEIVKGRLEFEGIPAILKYESAGMVIGVTVDGLGQIDVQVPEAYQKRALEILSRKESDYPSEPNR